MENTSFTIILRNLTVNYFHLYFYVYRDQKLTDVNRQNCRYKQGVLPSRPHDGTPKLWTAAYC